MLRVAFAFGLLAATLATTVAAAGPYRAPRTPFGQPDLQGVWDSETATPLMRPAEFKSVEVSDAAALAYERHANDLDAQAAEFKKAFPRAPDVGAATTEWPIGPPLRLARIGGVARASILIDPPDGKLPLLPAARERLKARRLLELRNFDSPEARPLVEQCLIVSGPPMLVGDSLRIVQTRDHVVLAAEFSQGARIVSLRNGRHGPAELAPWMGDSIGRWEGDTLVVETTNFNPSTAFWSVGVRIPLSAQAKVTERFSRTSAQEIIYRFTVEDPANYARPWSGVMPLRPGGRQFGYECHEGNYAIANILAGARRAERDGGAPEPLDGGDPPAPATRPADASAPPAWRAEARSSPPR